ncbi:hypothetical protein [Zavarzinia sp.]|uniref:hypothetical protein n=1 Tax=Zavarzinia sp. TaxID=2027920 RepID=UPI003BB72066
MAGLPERPLVFYSPPLRLVVANGAEWTFETLVVGSDGYARRLPGGARFTETEGRKACAAHVIAQMRVDRDVAQRRRDAGISLVAIVDLASWQDLCLAYGVAGDIEGQKP